MNEEIYDEIEQLIHGSKPDLNVCELPDAFYRVKNKNDLVMLIHYSVEFYGTECNLNWIDIFNVYDMSDLFTGENGMQFNGDISRWNTRNVLNMTFMFKFSKFNGDLSKWNTKRVSTMREMFAFSEFTGENGSLENWNVSNVHDMSGMFRNTDPVSMNLNKWNVTSV